MAQPQGPGQLAPETAGAHSDGALVYGVAQRRARKNEDRYVVAVAPTSTRKDGTQSPPWCDLLLAVFDGHNGWRAAEECVRSLPKKIGQRLAQLEEGPGGREVTEGPGWPTMARSTAHHRPLSSYEHDCVKRLSSMTTMRDLHGAFSCFLTQLRTPPLSPPQLDKAILQGFNDIDLEIRSKYPDGTTATVILLKLSPDGAWSKPLLQVAPFSKRVLALAPPFRTSVDTHLTTPDASGAS